MAIFGGGGWDFEWQWLGPSMAAIALSHEVPTLEVPLPFEM